MSAMPIAPKEGYCPLEKINGKDGFRLWIDGDYYNSQKFMEIINDIKELDVNSIEMAHTSIGPLETLEYFDTNIGTFSLFWEGDGISGASINADSKALIEIIYAALISSKSACDESSNSHITSTDTGR